MEKIKELFAKHPYLASGGAIAVFILFYYLFSRGSGSGTTYTTGSGGGGTDAQTAAFNAQENIAQLQAQTALAAKQIDASTASEQINAAHDIALTQTGAQLEALKSNNTTQVSLAQIQAGANEAQSKALEDIVTAQYTTEQHKTDDVYAYLTSLSSNQYALQNHALTVQQQESAAALAHIKDVNGSQNRTAIILAAEGNPVAANTAAAGQTASSVSGDSLLKSIASSALAAIF
jgi:hypothetical protein